MRRPWPSSLISKPLIASNDLDSAVCYLHRTLRNKFQHFLPGGWSILVDELPSVLLRCLSAFHFLRSSRTTFSGLRIQLGRTWKLQSRT